MKKRRRKNPAPTALAAMLACAAFGCTSFAKPPVSLPQAAAFCGSFLCAPKAAAAAAQKVLDESLAQAGEPVRIENAVPAMNPEPVLQTLEAEAAKPDAVRPKAEADFSNALAAETAASAPVSFSPMRSDQPAPIHPGPIPDGMAPLTQRYFTLGSGAGYVPCGASVVRNCTQMPDSEVAAEMMQPLPFSITPNSEEPQVLIVHTHTTECYEDSERCWCDPDFSARTTDLSKNVAAVGDALCAELNAAGIVTLHDTTLHDYPSYTGSYAKSHETVTSYLERYPSIKVVLDVHRDAIGAQDGSRTKPAVELDGKKCAQVMLICGADNGGNLPNCKQNLRFASRFQDQMERMFPGLARPVLFDYRYYNQDLSTGSLLIEVGGHANTLDEAVYAGSLVGKALSTLLLAP